MALHWRVAMWSSVVAVMALAVACTSRGSSPDPAAIDVVAATKETQDWRAQHEESYRKNWATIAGLHFLEPGTHTAGTAATNDIVLPASAASERIGRFVLDGDAVRFEPDARSSVQIDGQPVTKPRELTDDSMEEPDSIEVGAIRMVVHRSGDRRSLRVWDP
ncbi:MAG TPA: FHA domain-containing protein, partial [Vicinamibacterales bacterium]